MSKKTAKKRSTKSAVKALRRKRHNKNRANYELGGRVKAYSGFSKPYTTTGISDPNPEEVPKEESTQTETTPEYNFSLNTSPVSSRSFSEGMLAPIQTSTSNPTSGLVDQEAREERLEQYDTQLSSALQGELSESATASDAIPIADAGSGTIVQIEDRPDAIAGQATEPTEEQVQQGVTAQADITREAEAGTYDAALTDTLAPTQAAQGALSPEAIAQAEEKTSLTQEAVAAERDLAQEQAALAEAPDFEISDGAYVNRVTGEVADVAPTPEAEKQQREAITGEPADAGQAAEIIGIVGYEQTKNRIYGGQDAVTGATTMLSQVGGLPTDVSASIVEDPATVEAQIDEQPVEVQAAVAALPTEALVSSQMETLLSGIEDGQTPMWARPAVAAIEQKMAQRGMTASTVGRDALFNAIISAALPMAQSNAQALQQRAAQNLSNEQQANLTQATQTMQLRLANLANRQTAASQTAQYAQEMSVLQSQFRQQGVMAEMQIANQFLAKNAEFQQQMNLANLSNDQQMRLANLSALNQAESENLTAAQQTELANLNARMQTNLLQGRIAAEMNVAQLNVDQQRAVQNAAMVANVDMAKFSAEQQVELANSRFMQTMTMADLNNRQQAAIQNATAMAQLDLATVDQRTKLAVQNAQAFLAMDMANLNNEQQALMLDQQMRQQRSLSDQAAANAARQFNAASENQTNQFMASMEAQMNQFNVSQSNAMEQFNATEANRISAINAGNQLEADRYNSQITAQVSQFNAQLDYQAEQWNAANAQAVEQSNIDWRRRANLADTAAQNAANQQQAQFQFNLDSQEQAQMWQQLRDQALFTQQSSESERDRLINVINAALSNEAFMTDKKMAGQRQQLFNMLNRTTGGAAAFMGSGAGGGNYVGGLTSVAASRGGAGGGVGATAARRDS